VNVARYSKGSAKYVLTGGQDRTVRLWNANLGTEVKTVASHGYEVLSITVYVHSPSLSALPGISRKFLKAPRIMPNSRRPVAIVLSSCGTLQVVLPRGVLQHI
jgi:WD40 repeat protein